MCLASRTYAVLEEVLEDLGELAPSHGKREADRAVARVFDVAVSTARNWRRCRHQHVAHQTALRLIERCRDLAPEHVGRLEFLDHLAEGGQSLKTAAERLLAQMSAFAVGDWHLYDAPLSLAFRLDVSPTVRGAWIERSALLVERILDAGLDHTDVPVLPELIRTSSHGWHHASRFDLREKSLGGSWSSAWLAYFGRIERALYFGDLRAMPALFSGHVDESARHTETARRLLADVSDEDLQSSPVSAEDATTMVDAVAAQVHACHATDGSGLTALGEKLIARDVEHAWVDSVRCGALGYLALRSGDPSAAADWFEHAAHHVDAWLQRAGVAFGSSPHLALSGHALLRAHGDPNAAAVRLHRALHRSLEHGVIVDEIAARRCLAAACAGWGHAAEAAHHAVRALQLAERHDLAPWHDALGRLISR